MLKLKRSSSTTVSARPALAYEIVSDYAGYSQWIPGILNTRVLAQESNFAIVEIEFAAGGGKKLTLECIHAPTSMVVLRSLSGNTPAIKMQWLIKPDGTGQSQVTLKLEGPITLPFLVGYQGFFDPGRGLDGLRGVVAAAGDGPAGEKLIEIIETEDGLFCTYQGNKYRMEATPNG